MSKKDEIINRKDTFIVKAGPGSGKTYTVAAKLASELKNWQYHNRGIAAISFTNVAWQEIVRKLRDDLNINNELIYPHFVGTIDSFINKYIFLPFGHLEMGCKNRPEIMINWSPKDFGKKECKKRGCNLNDFSYDIHGKLVSYNEKINFSNCIYNNIYCKNIKNSLHKQGYATQLDANYFTMKLLKKYPQLAKAVAYRFPVLFVDEAQDTSEIQMEILKILKLQEDLKQLVLIGDPNQAIYEWRTANPHIFIKMTYELDKIELNENWRSSKYICEFTDKLVPNNPKSYPMNADVKDFNFKPQIWSYSKDESFNRESERLITEFLNTCDDHNIEINKENVAILVRGKNSLSELRGHGDFVGKSPWREQKSKNGKIVRDNYSNHYKRMAESKYLFDNKQYQSAFRLLENTICSLKLDEDYVSIKETMDYYATIGITEWRKCIYQLLIDLPKTDLILEDWVEKANEVILNNNFLNIDDFKIRIKKAKKEKNYPKMNFDQIFGNISHDDVKFTLGTVHSVKGNTFEAVLLILKEKTSKKYTNILDKNIENEEELRVVYVALTRPRKILVLAVPETDRKCWKYKFSRNKSYQQTLLIS